MPVPFIPRHPMAPPPGACGRGCAPVPNSMWGRGLFERSEFRSPNNRDRGKGTRRATPGRPWFWVLLPKQKDLVVRGRNPASTSPFCHPRRLSPTPVPDLIGDPIKEWIQSSRGSSVFGLCLFPSSPRHHMAPPQGACGRGCAPVPKLRKHSSPRRAGAETPHAPLSFCHPGLDPGSSVFVFAFSPPVILANAGIQRLFFVFVLCSCSRVIPGQSQGHAS